MLNAFAIEQAPVTKAVELSPTIALPKNAEDVPVGMSD
jgi:hypothetical protein